MAGAAERERETAGGRRRIGVEGWGGRGWQGRGRVMSGERTDNEVLLDYTDLFGPGRERQCEALLKTSNCRPGTARARARLKRTRSVATPA